MPIRRTYACPECMYQWQVVLTLEQADEPPPQCPRCSAQSQQEFRAPGIVGVQGGGIARERANRLVEDIVSNDYGAANFHRDNHEGSTPRVTYKDQGNPAQRSTWGVAGETLQAAISEGRKMRLAHGSGLDALQANLKSGAQPDLIEVSKRRSGRIW